jgi:hypothetical protein
MEFYVDIHQLVVWDSFLYERSLGIRSALNIEKIEQNSAISENMNGIY